MYVRDELGDFSECAYSLLLSISISSPIRGGDQRAAGRRLASFYTTKELFSLLVVCVRFIDTFALHRVLMSMTLLSLLCS